MYSGPCGLEPLHDFKVWTGIPRNLLTSIVVKYVSISAFRLIWNILIGRIKGRILFKAIAVAFCYFLLQFWRVCHWVATFKNIAHRDVRFCREFQCTLGHIGMRIWVDRILCAVPVNRFDNSQVKGSRAPQTGISSPLAFLCFSKAWFLIFVRMLDCVGINTFTALSR